MAERRGLRTTLETLFAVDLRSLAVFRIALAVALLYDVVDRSGDLVALYSNQGVLHADVLVSIWGRGALASPLVHLGDHPPAIAFFFVLQGAAAVALALGYRTRFAACLCWLLLVSIQVRNPFAAALGGDKFLRIVLFWALFLPLGARASLDARRAARSGAALPQNSFVSAGSAALLIQICVMYWMTGLQKSGELWRSGEAVRYALHLDYWASSLGLWLREREALLPWITHGTRWFEILGPLLVFVPVRIGPVRVLTIGLFTGFHLGLALFMDIGPFPLFCIVAWTAFLPGWLWDDALPRLGTRLGAWAEPPDPERPTLRTRRALQWLPGVLITYVLGLALVTVGALRFAGIDSLPGPVHWIGHVLRINQRWSMFAPDPRRTEVWPVVHGRLADGSTIDPLREAPVLEQKPALVSASFPSFRWRLFWAYMMNVGSDDRRFAPLQRGIGEHLCRRWNETHQGPQHLVDLRLEYWLESTDDPGRAPQRHSVFRHLCP